MTVTRENIIYQYHKQEIICNFRKVESITINCTDANSSFNIETQTTLSSNHFVGKRSLSLNTKSYFTTDVQHSAFLT